MGKKKQVLGKKCVFEFELTLSLQEYALGKRLQKIK